MSPRARALFLALILIVAAVCVRLGLWQSHRLVERRALNAVYAARRAMPPLHLPGDPLPADSGGLTERRLRVTGRYDAANQTVLRGMPYRDAPGVHLITPLRIAGSDSAVLIDRGFVPAADAVHPDLNVPPDTGVVTVSGLALALRTLPDSGQPVTSGELLTWRRLDWAALERRLGYPLLDVFLLASRPPEGRGEGSFPIAIPEPELTDGPHLSYAIQWFAFATIAVVGGAILIWRSR
ncbi:MAG: SURF1 family protein [Gemmatimonadales bacterium]